MTDIRGEIKPVLVIGATGRQGGTGLGALRALLARGVPVRALVRSPDERAEQLRNLGAEVVQGDLMDYRSLLLALEGVEAAYFCYPVTAGVAEAAGMFAAAGRETGLKRIVDLSLGSTSEYAASPQVRAQWVAERIFEWAGFDGTHLRVGAFFMENILLIDSAEVRKSQRIANAFGDLQLGWIAGADVGAVAAALLLEPEVANGRTLKIGGAESRSYPEITTMLSAVTGSSIRYEELTPEQWREEILTSTTAAGNPNPRAADHLSNQARSLRGGAIKISVSDHVQALTGRAPTTLFQFLADRRDDFL